jgi:hypothetical protein
VIKAIETTYGGYRLRSRLEARWCVCFRALGIPYEYEPEGFDLDGTLYLPDFWLPEQRCYFEVKGERTNPWLTDSPAQQKAIKLARASGYPVIIAGGQFSQDDPMLTCYYPMLNDVGPQVGDVVLRKCLSCGIVGFVNTIHGVCGSDKGHIHVCDEEAPGCGYRRGRPHAQLKLAFDAARQARFEYGECG